MPSTENWKSPDALILPLAFQVTTHLEIFQLCTVLPPPSPLPLGSPFLPSPSLKVPKPPSTGSFWALNRVQPFHHFLYAGLISFMTGTWFMFFCFVFFCLFVFIGPHPWHIGVLKLGVQSEL